MRHPEEGTITWLLLKLVRLHRRSMNEKLLPAGLTAGQEVMLRAVEAFPESNILGLANVMEIREPTVTRSVNRLLKSGLISRRYEYSVKHRVQVSLSDEGEKKIPSIIEAWYGLEDKMLSGLTSDEREQFRNLLDKVIENIESDKSRSQT